MQNQIKHSWIIFSLGLFLSIVIYTFLYCFTFQSRPLIGDDVLTSVLSQQVNLVQHWESDGPHFSPLAQLNWREDLEKLGLVRLTKGLPKLSYVSEGRLISLLHEERQSGLPSTFLGRLAQWWGPLQAFQRFQSTCSLISLVLFGLILMRLWGPTISCLGMFFLAIDPLEVASYAPDVNEKLLKPCFLVMGLMLTFRRSMWVFIAGLMAGIGIIIKITFLWYLGALLILIWNDYSQRQRLYFFVGMLAPLSLWTGLIQVVPLGQEIFHSAWNQTSPFAAVLQAMGDKSAYLSYLNNINFIQDYYQGLKGHTINPQMLLWLALFLMPLFWHHWIKRLKSQKKVYQQLQAGLWIFVILCFFSLLKYDERPPYHEYFFSFSILLATYWSHVLRDLWMGQQRRMWTRGLCFVILGGQMVLTYQWIQQYRSGDIIPQYNYRVIKNLVKDLEREKIKSPYTMGRFIISNLEFVSEEKIWPIHLLEMKSLSFVDLIQKVGDGVYVLNMYDIFGEQFKDVWELKPRDIVTQLISLDYEVKGQQFYLSRSGRPLFWKFKVESLSLTKD